MISHHYQRYLSACLVLAVCFAAMVASSYCQADAPSAPGSFPGKKSVWNGFDRYDFELNGRQALVVTPKQVASGKPWIWRARFFGHEPAVDLALLSRGFHLVYIDVAELFGNPQAVGHFDAFYQFLTEKHGLAKKPALEGLSRGGLIIFNWAAANPNKVACIYADAPVCDIKSWPGGLGKGTGSTHAWSLCLMAWNLTAEQALTFKGNPIDHLKPIAQADVPLLHVCGGADRVVPLDENTRVLEARYKKLGGRIDVIVKPDCGHHPHSLKDPTPIIQFILKHTGHLGSATADAAEKAIRLGIIGLDTSHVTHFTKYLNDPANKTGCKVVAAYPGGSADIPASADRLEGFTKQLREQHGVEIVDSIEELCKRVDGVLLESVDGRPHLEQVKPVIAAKKPVFIDKPVAGNLADAIEIFRLAKEAGVPCWSSSTWRFTHGVREVQGGKVGKVVGAVAFGPCSIESHHPDLYWYGIHTTEALFALMGPGCESVTRTTSGPADVVVGKWKDDRIGIFRGGRHSGAGAGFMAFGSKGVHQAGHDGGYPVLLAEIVKFFKTGKAPVPAEETIELFAFMSAADESKAQGGAPVTIESVIAKAKAASRPKPASAKPEKKLRVVFFGAHCDDSELSAGGLMAMLSQAGHEVISAYGTTFRGQRKIGDEPEDTVRRRESTASCKILGATPHFFPYAHEALFADPATIEAVRKWLEQVKPDIVVAHWPMDTHPNHHVVSSLAWLCYNHQGRVWGQDPTATEKPAAPSWNLYFYEVNTFTKNEDLQSLAFQPQLYLDVEKVRDVKHQAIECLKSQNPAALWAVHDNMHRERGKECGVKYAEAYFLVEPKPGCPTLPVPFIKKK